MRKPENIIGKDALTQLAFEGYIVVPVSATPDALGAWYRRKSISGSDYEAYRDLTLVASGACRAEDLCDDRMEPVPQPPKPELRFTDND